jgi:hypothetical protein
MMEVVSSVSVVGRISRRREAFHGRNPRTCGTGNRGGVYYNIEGANPVAVLRDIVQTVSLPKNLDRETLLQAVLEREA